MSPSDPPARPRPKPGILDIAPYIGGKSKAVGFEHPVKLSSNENVLGCSPAAREAYLRAADRMHMYPDGKAMVLREAIAAKFRIEPERLVFGCGSDELFMLLAQVYLEPGDNIVQTEFGFLSYRIAARACQAEVRFAHQPGLKIDVDAILSLVERTGLVFVAIPDNPTGAWLSDAEVARLHAGLPGDVILVLDSAYYEFADDPSIGDPLNFARRAENVIVTRTFSKMYGLAGLRVGWGYGPPAMVDGIERVRLPFNVSIPAMEAAVAALGDDAFVERSRALVQRWRPWLAQQLGGLGIEVFPTQTNFVLVRFPNLPGRTAADAEGFLAKRGILVRGLANYHMAEYVRITIGHEADNRAVAEGLAAFVESSGMSGAIYPRVAVIGAGLIGGSIVRAARAVGAAGQIVIADINPAFREKLAALAIADEVTGDAREAVSGADLVVIATFPGAVEEVLREIAPHLKPGATVTDVSGVKEPVTKAMAAVLPPGVFGVPGHPIAGTEQSGPDAGFAELFQNRWVILCPLHGQGPDYEAAAAKLRAFWEAIGANVECMDDKHHDLVLAVTSHLPHLIAYTIVGTAAHLESVSEGEVMKYSAGGFRDFTRIAASDPTMWRDLFLLNKDAVLEILGRFTEDVHQLSRAIRYGDGQTLYDHFAKTREIRRGVIAAGQENAEPNFGRDKARKG